MTEIVDHREFLPGSASRAAPAADNRAATLAALTPRSRERFCVHRKEGQVSAMPNGDPEG
jgi:hypothetical protein